MLNDLATKRADLVLLSCWSPSDCSCDLDDWLYPEVTQCWSQMGGWLGAHKHFKPISWTNTWKNPAAEMCLTSSWGITACVNPLKSRRITNSSCLLKEKSFTKNQLWQQPPVQNAVWRSSKSTMYKIYSNTNARQSDQLFPHGVLLNQNE